jgi:hypothetical protein
MKKEYGQVLARQREEAAFKQQQFQDELERQKEEAAVTQQQFQDLLDIKEKELDEFKKKPVRLFYFDNYVYLFRLIYLIQSTRLVYY